MIGDLKYSLDLDRSKFATNTVAAANDLRGISRQAEATDADLKRFADSVVRQTQTVAEEMRAKKDRMKEAFLGGHLPFDNYVRGFDQADGAIKADEMARARATAAQNEAETKAQLSQRESERLGWTNRVMQNLRETDLATQKKIAVDVAKIADQRVQFVGEAAEREADALAYRIRSAQGLREAEVAHMKKLAEDQAKVEEQRLAVADRRTAKILDSERQSARNLVNAKSGRQAFDMTNERQRVAALENLYFSWGDKIENGFYGRVARGVKAAGSEQQRFAGNSDKWMRAFQQLSFGLEDATSQFGTMGLAGAIRGGSNNISAALMSFGPAAGLLGSLGATALMVGTQFFDSSKNVEQFKEKVDAVAAAVEDSKGRLERFGTDLSRRFALDDLIGADANTAGSAARQASRDLEQLTQERFEKQFAVTKTMRAKLEEEEKKLIPQTEPGWSFGPEAEMAARNAAERLAGVRDLMKRTNQDLFVSPDAMPSGLLSDEELKTIQQQKDEYDKLGQSIATAKSLREKALEVQKEAADAAMEQRKSEVESNLHFDQWDRAQQILQDIQTPSEKYRLKLLEISKLHKDGYLNVDESKRSAEKARKEMQKELDKGLRATVMIAGATEFGTAGSFTGLQTALQNYLIRPRNIGTDLPIDPSSIRSGLSPEQKQFGADAIVRGMELLRQLIAQQMGPANKTAQAAEGLLRKKDPTPVVFNF